VDQSRRSPPRCEACVQGETPHLRSDHEPLESIRNPSHRKLRSDSQILHYVREAPCCFATRSDGAGRGVRLRNHFFSVLYRKRWGGSIGERFTMHVLKVVEHYGHSIVTANVDGDYDKRGLPDPLVLTPQDGSVRPCVSVTENPAAAAAPVCATTADLPPGRPSSLLSSRDSFTGNDRPARSDAPIWRRAGISNDS
jgi:hypothetical protein